jgi:WD40 repeat protein
MTENRDFFTAESVDEQVERISSRQPGEPAQTRHVRDFQAHEDGQGASARLVKELHAFYQADYEQNRACLAHARRRIAAHQFDPSAVNQARSPMAAAPVQRFSQERTRKIQSPRSAARRVPRSLDLLAAVLVTGLLVSTLVLMLTLKHSLQNSQGIGGAKATVTGAPTSPPVSTGTILSTRKSPAGTNFASAAWSPDGKRMAASAIDLKTGKTLLYIWDAASGKDLLIAHLDVASLNEVLWSPMGRYLALDNLQTIAIVDSQSGVVVKTIDYSPPLTFKAPGASQQLWLAHNAPLGGGFGFYSVAWSTDGASLAVAVSDITTGRVVLLDPLSGAVKTTFREQARPIGFPLSFSSDGQYLAVSYPNDSTVVVWDVATQHVAIVFTGAQSMSIAWQPGTHDLARSTLTSVELWDVHTHKLLKTYKGGSAFTWSPDGKELAVYDPPFAHLFSQTETSHVTILNADTGARVGLYTSHNQMIFSASWSPNGRSIATSESSAGSNQIVIWAA